jgi:uncharacterized protein
MLKRFLPVAAITICLYFLLSSVALSGINCAVEPGFDCSKALSDAEKLICTDNKLAELDNQLRGVYQTALGNFPERERKNLKAMQRGWIKGRDDCWKADNLRSCVQYAYESRIVELQIQGGQLTVPEPVNYRCESGEYDYLTAIFFTDTLIPVVVLTGNTGRDSWQATLILSPSGSGAKYTGQDMLFWSKDKEAMVQWGEDDLLKCTILEQK